MPSAPIQPKPTVLSLAEDLAAGRTTSRALIEMALARIADPTGEGARTFVKVYSEMARACRCPGPLARRRLCRLAARRTAGVDQGPLRRGR